MSSFGTTTIFGDLTVTGELKTNNVSGGGSYLPLSGGTLTGDLNLVNGYPCVVMNQNGLKSRLITDNNHFWIEGTSSGSATPTSRLSFRLTDGELFIGNASSRVYHQGFKPTPTDIGAARAFTVANGHEGIILNNGSAEGWVRTTIHGLIPYQSGGASSVGTTGWPFNNVHSNNYFLRGLNLESFIPVQIGDSAIIKNRLSKSGFYEHSTCTIEEGYPIAPVNGWMHVINCQHSNTENNYALQIASPFHEQRFFARNTNHNGSMPWSELSIGRGAIAFGGNQSQITTADFIALLRNMGAFQSYHWTSRGTWSYASNQIINDTNLGNIHLAGATVEKIGYENECTIRITLPTTSASNTFLNTEYVYVSNGSSYSPTWRRNLTMTSVPNRDGCFDNTATAPTGTTRMNYSGYFYATRNYNAVWNDYAEYFEKQDPEDQDFEPGDVIASINNKYIKSTSAYQETVIGVYSDSYGHIVGGTGDIEKDDKECIPVGLAGRVKVKVVGTIKEGQLLTSSDIPGVAMYAKDFKPGTIIGKAVESKDTDDIQKVFMFVMNT